MDGADQRLLQTRARTYCNGFPTSRVHPEYPPPLRLPKAPIFVRNGKMTADICVARAGRPPRPAKLRPPLSAQCPSLPSPAAQSRSCRCPFELIPGPPASAHPSLPGSPSHAAAPIPSFLRGTRSRGKAAAVPAAPFKPRPSPQPLASETPPLSHGGLCQGSPDFRIFHMLTPPKFAPPAQTSSGLC